MTRTVFMTALVFMDQCLRRHADLTQNATQNRHSADLLRGLQGAADFLAKVGGKRTFWPK